MKTIDEIKDEIAQKHGYNSWTDYIITYPELNELDERIDEAMQEYARVCCYQQKSICSSNIKYGERNDVFKNRISVTNAKLATEL